MAQTSLGTPFFLPPEMCKGETYNNKADIWMLGCLLYELCSLKKPFVADGLINLMKVIVTQSMPDIPNHYSNDLKLIVKLLTNKDDFKRPYIREILDNNIIVEKMKKYNITDVDYSDIINKNYSTKTLNNNNINEEVKYKSTKHIHIQNPESKVTENNTQNLNNNNNIPNTKIRKRLKIPDKINKKYESMGAQAIDKVMNDMNLNNNDIHNLNFK